MILLKAHLHDHQDDEDDNDDCTMMMTIMMLMMMMMITIVMIDDSNENIYLWSIGAILNWWKRSLSILGRHSTIQLVQHCPANYHDDHDHDYIMMMMMTMMMTMMMRAPGSSMLGLLLAASASSRCQVSQDHLASSL